MAKDRSFIEDANTILDKLNQGIIPKEVLYVNVLKGERLPREKVIERKSRLFCYTSIAFLFVVRRLFGMYVRNIEANHQYTTMAIGMNPLNEDWDHMIRSMLRIGNNFICGDYSKFDSTIPYEMARHFADYISDLYDDDYRVARRTLMSTSCASRNLIYKYVYQQYQGNPAGCIS